MGNRVIAEKIMARRKAANGISEEENDKATAEEITRALDDKDAEHTNHCEDTAERLRKAWLEIAAKDARIAELEAENAKLKTAVVGTRNDALLEQLWRERGDSVTRLKSERDEAVKRAEIMDGLLADRERVYREFPCPAHGGNCVPGTMEQIRSMQAAFAAEKERNRKLVEAATLVYENRPFGIEDAQMITTKRDPNRRGAGTMGPNMTRKFVAGIVGLGDALRSVGSTDGGKPGSGEEGK